MRQLTNDTRARMRDASNMIPGMGVVNALNGRVRSQQAQRNTAPTPRSQAAASERARLLRRARVAQRLQNDAAQAGRARLSQREIDTTLSEYGLD